MPNDLLIRINADAKNAEKAFDDIRKQTEDLEGQLNKIALISGAAFAAFTAEIHYSVKAFEEAQGSAVQLNTALQNQGIYTEELAKQYKSYATAVQAATGIDDDVVSKAQAVAQTYLGQTKITEKLTFAIADLGASMGGDLNAAAEKIARTIGTGTNAFARQGLVIDAGATQAERYAKVLEFVTLKSNGLAAAMNQADGYSKALTTAFGNLQEEIGSRFAPVVSAARETLVHFFEYLSNNPAIVDAIASFITAGAIVTGFIATAAALVPVFTTLSAAATAFGISLNIAFLGIPLIIGVVVAAITLLALNWDKAMASMRAAAAGMVTFVTEIFAGWNAVLDGAMSLSTTKIKAGLAQITGAFAKAKQETISTYTEITAIQKAEGEKQNEDKKKQADKEAALARQHQANLRAIRTAELDLLKLQNENASALVIDLKSKEIETLKALDSQKSAEEKAQYKARYEIIKGLQTQQNAEDLERQKAFGELQKETTKELADDRIAVEADISRTRLAELRATAQVEADIDRKLQDDILSKRIQARNTEMLEKKKFGVAYATINKAIQSDEVQGTKSAAGELVQLSSSKNAQLKSIGKVAAVAQIAIATAESAMNIFRGFSAIPIVGPALGIAGAAAAVAFGAERIEAVTAAADGGLITGGRPGLDSVPAMLMPGELVVPSRNYDEVVGSVAASRAGESGGGGNGFAEIVLSFKDSLGEFIEAKLIERQRIGVSILTTKLA